MVAPTAFFPGIAYLGASDPAPAAGIFIPLADLSGLTAAEADEATGDGRKVAYELIKAIQAKYAAMPTKPQRLTVTVGTPTGVTASVVRQSYTLAFDVDITGVDLATEPT